MSGVCLRHGSNADCGLLCSHRYGSDVRGVVQYRSLALLIEMWEKNVKVRNENRSRLVDDDVKKFLIELDVDAPGIQVCYQMHMTDWYSMTVQAHHWV